MFISQSTTRFAIRAHLHPQHRPLTTHLGPPHAESTVPRFRKRIAPLRAKCCTEGRWWAWRKGGHACKPTGRSASRGPMRRRRRGKRGRTPYRQRSGRIWCSRKPIVRHSACLKGRLGSPGFEKTGETEARGRGKRCKPRFAGGRRCFLISRPLPLPRFAGGRRCCRCRGSLFPDLSSFSALVRHSSP